MAHYDTHARKRAEPHRGHSSRIALGLQAGLVWCLILLLSLISARGGAESYTGVLAGWDVSGVSGYGPSPLSSTTNVPNLTSAGLTRGPGIGTSYAASDRAWGGNNWTNSTPAAAIASGCWATFGVSAHAGYVLSCSAISRLSYRRSSTGPTNGVLQYQVGSRGFVDITNLIYSVDGGNGAALAPIDLSGITALQNIHPGVPVAFRLVNYGGTSARGTWYVFDVNNSPALDLTLQGTLSSAQVHVASGTVLVNESGKPLPGVSVQLGGDTEMTVLSDAVGLYHADLVRGSTFSATPRMTQDEPVGNGVTTLDLALIRRHILGLAPLDSPCRLLAADANASRSVTTLDIALIRRLILGLTNSLPAGLWRFVPSNHSFADPLSPWDAPTNRWYTNLVVDTPNQDWLAIKLGDVNNSWMVPAKTASEPPGHHTGEASVESLSFDKGSASAALRQKR